MRNKAKSFNVFLIFLIATSSFLGFFSFISIARADEPLYGVRGEQPESLGTGVVSDYEIARDFQGKTGWDYGVDTLIDPNYVDNQITLLGPSRIYPSQWPPLEPYVKSLNLQWQLNGSYRPFMIIRSAPWYNHKFELCQSSSNIITVNYEISLGIKTGYGSASYTEGGTTKTIQDEFQRWEYTITDSKTAVIYFWVTYLRVEGTITYWDDSVVNYDLIALQSIDLYNKHKEEYNWNEPIEELPEGLVEDFYDKSLPYGIPDKFYDVSDKDSIGWRESEEYSNSASVSFKLGGDPSPEDPWWMGLYLQVDFSYIEAGRRTLELVHTFTQIDDRPLNYFFYIFENAFSIYLLPEQEPVATIQDPSPGATEWDYTCVIIHGEDNSEVVNARLWVSSDASLNEEYDTEIIDIYSIHLDDNWFISFNTNDFSDGTKYLFAKVYDRFGMDGINPAMIPINIENDGWGNIIYPTQGETKLYGDDIYFAAVAYDHSGVDSVQFKLDSGSWQDAAFNTLYQQWILIWYESTLGTHTLSCREIDTFDRATVIDSVTFYVDYGTILTKQVSPITYSDYEGGTTEGKYDDDIYYRVRCTDIGWGWWESYTRFYFDSYTQLITTKYELQILPCTPLVEVRTKYTDGTLTGWTGLSTTISSIQSVNLDPNKKVNYIEIHHLVWWETYQWLDVDFIRLRYRIY